MSAPCPHCGSAIPRDGRFCSSCGQAIDQLTSAPTRTAAANPADFSAGSPSSSSASDGGRFLPGQVLAERYRVIGLLGRGGMGEVYRADDLKLGQPVALKFLPEAFSRDEARLDRFFNEVRTARQVSHPNVCRVHDLGEVDGHHFLSMEYVDGEDLGTLLRRIGHVPKDKAVQVARQLCAGVAAAHDEGILHRDLKPANIMLDGRGRARITDFGLAGLAESIEGGEIRAGTPAYQAPEQLAGTEVTKASDIYALGLVLYELFTGKRAFDAKSSTELRNMQQNATPASLTSHVDGLDDTIERIIMRCLDPDPRKRPPSALAISAALPGGDPLAAALAAGETPSPEMVANAEVKGALKLPVAIALLLFIILGTAAEFGYRSRHAALARVGLPKAPAELQVLARQALEHVGADASGADTAWGLKRGSYYSWVMETDESAERWDNLESVRPHPVYFWYRQSPEWMAGEGFDLRITEDEPPLTAAGMSRIRLDATGRLLEFYRVSPDTDRAVSTSAINWETLLLDAQLDPANLTEVPARARPLLNCESRIAWEGSYGGPDDAVLHVEACGASGEPLYFEVFPPWSDRYADLRKEPGTVEPANAGADETPPLFVRIAPTVVQFLFVGALIGGLLLARRNLRLGRADRDGALRIATALFVIGFAAEILGAHNEASSAGVGMILEAAGHLLLFSFLAGAFYLAAEPSVRRFWPNAIIAWRRVLAGRLRDPLVGRDYLIGAAVAQIVILGRLSNAVFLQNPPVLLGGGDLESISGVLGAASHLLSRTWGTFFFGLATMTFLITARILLKRNWLTWLVMSGLIVSLMISRFFGNIPEDQLLTTILQITLYQGAVIFIGIRFGLLAWIVQFIYSGVGSQMRVLDPASWYFGYPIFYLLLMLIPALLAFWFSLGDRKPFQASLLDS